MRDYLRALRALAKALEYLGLSTAAKISEKRSETNFCAGLMSYFFKGAINLANSGSLSSFSYSLV